nr:immunoglobulin heavy chain junction region [Macaca mulatta]MOW80892.1 immunoglobulin heavy chain junction region [Macaca mulatta]
CARGHYSWKGVLVDFW